MKIIHAILFFCCVSFASLASADEMGPDAKSFESKIQSYFDGCHQMQCQTPHQARRIFAREESLFLEKEMYKTLTSVAFEQAQVWADTILEGDFHAAGQTRLDQVDALYEGDILIGYRITYSEKAWDLSQCNYYQTPVEHRDQVLQSCSEGRILEASFVSPGFTTFIRDSNQFAEFKANE